MTRPMNIPPPGAPLTGLSPLLSTIARAAQREDCPQAGLVGSEGTASAPPPQCTIALFKITGSFSQGPADSYPNSPGGNWWYAAATRVEYYPHTAAPPNNWATPTDEGDTATHPEIVNIWAPAALMQDSSIAAPNEYVWCWYDDTANVWVLIGQAPPRWQYTCYGARGGAGATIPADPNNWTEITNPAPAAPIPGTYLAAYSVSVGSTIPGDGPIECPFNANLAVNHVVYDIYNLQAGHFHCPTSNTGPQAWTVTIPAGSIDGTHPAAGLTLSLPAIGNPSYNYYAGQISWLGTLTLAKNDIVTVLVQAPTTEAMVINVALTLVLLHL